MGLILSRVLASFRKEARVLMLGLDAAGKTTVLHKLACGETVSTIPTIGFNVDTVQYKNVNFNVWDVGGQDKIRRLWRHYYTGSDALIFVVDASDRDRMKLAREEMDAVLAAPEMAHAAVLVLSNKQDLPDALPTAEVADKLGLHAMRSRKWYIQGSCATTGDGLYEGLDWLATTLNSRK